MSERKEAVRVCSIPGCNRPHDSRGWCIGHYRRWRRYGDPTAGGPITKAKTKHGAAQRFLWDVVVPYKGEDCLTWPFGRTKSGYGSLHFNGMDMEAHRVACIEVHGEPPTPKHEAAHSCGNGHLGCVNPMHLRWATSHENHLDCRAHGTASRSGRPKLSERQVLEIIRLRGKIPQKKIAERFSVVPSTIGMIHAGLNWSHLPRCDE